MMQNKNINPDCGYGVRHLQVMLYFMLVVVTNSIRCILPIAIVAMTSPTSRNPCVPFFPHWSNQGLLLTSYFFGYLITELSAGYLAKHYGTKWFLFVGLFLGGIFTILFPPLTVSFGIIGAIISRIFQGFFTGFTVPMVNDFLGKWIPISERTSLGTVINSGQMTGILLSTILTGFLSTTWEGWPSAFYLFGGLSICAAFLMGHFGSISPELSESITDAELIHILSGTTNKNTKPSIDLRKVLKSPPVWALLSVQCGYDFALYTLFTELPTYLKDVLGFSIATVTICFCVFCISAWILSFVFMGSANYLLDLRILTLGQSRKLFNSIGFFVPAIGLLCLAFFASSSGDAIFLFSIIVGTTSSSYCGFKLNYVDLSPNQAGILSSFGAIAGNISGLIGPLLVEIIVPSLTSSKEWDIVFIVIAIILIISNILFLWKGSAEVQEWDNEDKINYQIPNESDEILNDVEKQQETDEEEN